MVTPEIKICGINTPEAVRAVIKARADYMGLVFFPPSPRNVSIAAARELSAMAATPLRRVGLFVDANDSLIGEAVSGAGLDVVQLQGSETPQRAAQIKARHGCAVWKAMPIATRADLDRASAFAGAADLILLDAKTPKGALPGGMGLSFDWSILTGWQPPCAWGLAGGLNPDNVADAIRRTGAPLVDVSSGVESAPGSKDEGRIAAFCNAVRAAAGAA